MSNWITATDYKSSVRDNHLQMIIDNDDVALDSAELTAIQVVKDHLYQWYDTDAIFATSGADRPAQVLRWCVTLVLYYLYERVPDKLTPDRVIKNYDDTMEMLLNISDQKLSVDLPVKQTVESQTITKFRWGSVITRENQS